MDRGTEKHSQLERYVSGDAARMPRELNTSLGPLREEMKQLRKDNLVEVEAEVAVDRRWRLVEWNDPDAWGRAKFDVRVPDVNEAKVGTRIIDHKTGRERPSEHASQLELYTVFEFSTNVEIDYVIGEIFYVDHGKKMSVLYNNRDFVIGRLRKRWETRANKMLKDRRFAPTPGRACRWCPFSREKGGPCNAG
jgi:hypothetical protein